MTRAEMTAEATTVATKNGGENTTRQRPPDPRPPRPPTGPDRADPTASTRPDRVDPTKTTRPDRRRWWRPRRKATGDDRLVRGLVASAGGTVTAPGGRVAALVALVLTTVLSAGAAFVFSYGNVGNTASLVGVPWAQQKLVSPTVDVIVVGLTFVLHFLVIAQASRPAIAATRGILVGASAVMLVVNAAPAVLGALTTDYTGPLLTATRHFTPTPDQMTAGQLWGRAGIDALVPGFLVVWSHYFPRIVGAFAEIRSRSDLEALAAAQARTLATEADRAAADRLHTDAAALVATARAEATALVEQARAEATALVASGREEADQARQARAVASRSATETTSEADRRARRIELDAQARADEIIAAAARQARQAAAAAEADREAAAAEAHRIRAGLAADTGVAADAARRLAAEREALDRRAAEVDALAAQAARDMQYAEQVIAEAAEGRPAKTPTARPAAPAAPQAAGKRRPKEETIALGVAAWKAHHGDDWHRVPPKKADVMAVCGAHSEMALDIRARLMAEADGLSAHAGQALNN